MEALAGKHAAPLIPTGPHAVVLTDSFTGDVTYSRTRPCLLNGILEFVALISEAERLGRGRPATLQSIHRYRGEITSPGTWVATELLKTPVVVHAKQCKHSFQNNSNPAHVAQSIYQPEAID